MVKKELDQACKSPFLQKQCTHPNDLFIKIYNMATKYTNF